MMRFAAFVISLSGLLAADAQNTVSVSKMIEKRDQEVQQLVSLWYGVDIGKQAWEHRESAICPEFSHHIFAKYERVDPHQIAMSFIAIYPRTLSRVWDETKPWRGGIQILPISGFLPVDARVELRIDNTMQMYNNLWTQELKEPGSLKGSPRSNWGELANCFINLSGEQPYDAPLPEALDRLPMNLPELPVAMIVIRLAAPEKVLRNISIGFNKQGLISSAVVTESEALR